MSRVQSKCGKVIRVLAAAALFSSGVVLSSGAPAGAAGCTLGVICGRVVNASGVGLHTTSRLNESGLPHMCHIWNKNEGSGRSEVRWSCAQEYLGSGSSRGGNFTGNDVDAFTFNDRPYYLLIEGEWLLIQQGVWTKINSAQTATCIPYLSSAPQCVVQTTG